MIANGDIGSIGDTHECLRRSGADGVMIGRGAYGRPWFVSQVMQALAGTTVSPDPSIEKRLAIVLDHYDAMLEHYGLHTGVRIARKHLAWHCAGLPGAAEARATIFRLENPGAVRDTLRYLFRSAADVRFAQRAAA